MAAKLSIANISKSFGANQVLADVSLDINAGEVVSFIGGADRYQQEGFQYSPNFLQYEPADGFLGTSQVVNNDSRFINQSIYPIAARSAGISNV